MMAALWRGPVVVHEPGGVGGNTNRLLEPIADRVIVGMEGAFERKVAQRWVNRIPRPRKVDWLGTPVRAEIAGIDPPGERLAARTGPLRLLVVGGSLGAQTLNDLVLAALVSLPAETRPEVVHQSGEKLYERLHAAYRAAGLPGEVVPFIDDMARRYAWCDVLVCRSGAITVAEITAAGLAAILFPLPWFVADEQAANAHFLAPRNAGITLPQLETAPAHLASVLGGLNRENLADSARRPPGLGIARSSSPRAY